MQSSVAIFVPVGALSELLEVRAPQILDLPTYLVRGFRGSEFRA